LEKDSALKTAVSPELAKAVLIAKGVGLAMDDLVRASGPKRTIEQILAPLRKYKRTIRRAGPEARRHIFGPPQVEEPVRWANVAWKPDAATAGKMHVHRMLGIS